MVEVKVANPQDIAEPIYRAMILQNMALRYFEHMKGSPEDFTMGEAFEAAQATWDTQWPDDPAPRTMEAALDVVSSDLAYWVEE